MRAYSYTSTNADVPSFFNLIFSTGLPFSARAIVSAGKKEIPVGLPVRSSICAYVLEISVSILLGSLVVVVVVTAERAGTAMANGAKASLVGLEQKLCRTTTASGDFLILILVDRSIDILS